MLPLFSLTLLPVSAMRALHSLHVVGLHGSVGRFPACNRRRLLFLVGHGINFGAHFGQEASSHFTPALGAGRNNESERNGGCQKS